MKMKKKLYAFLAVLFIILVPKTSFAQFEIPEIPKFQTSVYDYAGILSVDEKSALEEKLIRYSDSTSTQIVIITIQSLKGEDIDVLSTNWAQKWGIGGSKDKDNGVVLLVAIDDRKMSIRPGYGVEDKLIAGVCGEIIRNVIKPEFKTSNYFSGLDKGTDAMFKVLQGKYKGTRKHKEPGGIPIGIIIFVFIILFLIFSRMKNKGNNGGNKNNGGGFGLAEMIILSSLGRNSGGGGFGGFGGGSSGGGGFGGGFGGGGFSGGGASGSW